MTTSSITQTTYDKLIDAIVYSKTANQIVPICIDGDDITIINGVPIYFKNFMALMMYKFEGARFGATVMEMMNIQIENLHLKYDLPNHNEIPNMFKSKKCPYLSKAITELTSFLTIYGINNDNFIEFMENYHSRWENERYLVHSR